MFITTQILASKNLPVPTEGKLGYPTPAFIQIFLIYMQTSHICVHNLFIFPYCRQKQKTVTKEERTPSAKSKSSSSQPPKLDSGYVGSGLEVSIATISAVDCVLEDEKSAKQSPKPSSRNDRGRSSVDSTSSSSGSSEKGRTEADVKKTEQKNAVDLKQKESIRKQMADRKKSAGVEKTSNKQSVKQRGVEEKAVPVRRSSEDVKKAAVLEEKRAKPFPVKSKTPRTEVRPDRTDNRISL